MEEFFEENSYYTGPDLTVEMVRRAEDVLGVRLPRGYTELLYRRNGGIPLRRCYRTDFRTSWAPDHIEISAILGIAGDVGIDTTSGGSAYLIEEWGYPNIGVVICDTPSAGHDTVMLDYSTCGSSGDPSVVYIDEDRMPRSLAESFDVFVSRLVSCSEFE